MSIIRYMENKPEQKKMPNPPPPKKAIKKGQSEDVEGKKSAPVRMLEARAISPHVMSAPRP